MPDSKIIDVIGLINSYRHINDQKIDAIQSMASSLTQERQNNHYEVMASESAGITTSPKQFRTSANVYDEATTLFTQLEEVNQENLMWVNLSIRYTNIAIERDLDLSSLKYYRTVSLEKRLHLLGVIIEDLEITEDFEYCAKLKTIYDAVKLELYPVLCN